MRLDKSIVCLVTGGASGLGLAAVKAFLAKGCRVVIADFDEKAGKQVLTELNTDSLKFFRTDVSDEKNVIQLVEFTIKEFGQIHIVVNSAGVISAGLTASPKGVVSTQELQRVFKVNVYGTVNVSKHCASKMLNQQPIGEFKERGVIINVASLAGIEGQKGQLVYAASKGAIIGMTLPMARELGRSGIRVITLAPGVFNTPMGQHLPKKIAETLENSAALRRLGNPEEFGQCVSGICMNSYITGEIIRLDGGTRMPHL